MPRPGSRGWRAGRDSFWAAANVRPARAAVRAVVFDAPCRNRSVGSTEPEPVDEIRGRDYAKRPQADGPAAVSEVLLGGHRVSNSLSRFSVTSFGVILNVAVYLGQFTLLWLSYVGVVILPSCGC